MPYAQPEFLIEAEQLNKCLDDPNLRIFDCAVYLHPQSQGGYRVESGREKYQQAHIPGAGFIDLTDAWASRHKSLNFTLPEHNDLCAAIGASGISPSSQVVLYSSGHLMWATRAWWLLHYAGHDNVAILNGNLRAWQAADYPLNSGTEEHSPSEFHAQPRTTQFADLAEVEAGMHGQVCTINALSKQLYEGTGDFFYQRRGHIPGSHLLHFDDILDNEFLLPAEALEQKLKVNGMLDAPRVITYCGGGIAATLDAFACKLMGQDNVGVYDGSMSEWVQDPSRPLTEGSNP